MPYILSDGARLSPEERAEYIKLDWNESGTPPSPVVRMAVAAAAISGDYLHHYPDCNMLELRKALAFNAHPDLDADNILVFCGSDGALRCVFDTCLLPMSSVLISDTTYTQIDMFAQAVTAVIDFVPSNELLEKISPRHRLVYICNPNNPDGIYYDRDGIRDHASNFLDTMFCVDEAYFEFSLKSMAGYVNKHQNIIVTRTFSKAWGLAGLRIGYAIAHKKTIAMLKNFHNPKDVNALAQVAVLAALRDYQYVLDNVRQVERAMNYTLNAMIAFKLDCVYAGNFITVYHNDRDWIVDELFRHKILVRRLPQIDNAFRVTIGTQEQMDVFTHVLQEILDRL